MKDINIYEYDLILGLGFRFWIKTITEQGIMDIEYSKNVINYLQTFLNDLVPENSRNSEDFGSYDMKSDLLDLSSISNFEETEAIIYSLGLKFWQNTIHAQNIVELNHCKVVLNYISGFLLEFCSMHPCDKKGHPHEYQRGFH